MKTFAFTIISFILLIFMMSSDKPFFTNESWDERWAIVDSLENILKFESALNATEELLEIAFEEKDRVNYLRAVSYSIQYNERLFPDQPEEVLDLLTKEMKRSGELMNAILNSFAGEFYHSYFQRHNWRIHMRTRMEDPDAIDIQRMSANQLLKKAGEHFLLSLESKLSKDIDIESLAWIISGDSAGRALRPNLYQVLLYRAVNFFSAAASQSEETGPERFVSSNDFFSLFENFVEFDISGHGIHMDSYLYQALILHQKALKFASDRKDLRSLGDADLSRLKFVHGVCRSNACRDWYREALENMYEFYAESDIQVAYAVELVEIYSEMARGYSFLPDDPEKWRLKNSVIMAEETLNKWPDSFWSQNLGQRIELLKSPMISFRMEEAVIPERDFLISLSYRNLANIKASIYRISKDDLRNWRQVNAGDLRTRITSRKPILDVSFEIPDDGDHHMHRVELPFEGLERGIYIMLVEPTNLGENTDDYLTWFYFQSSDLYLAELSNNFAAERFFILNRTTGEPVAGAQIRLYQEEYIRRSREYVERETGRGLTNDMGFMSLKVEGGNSRNFAEVSFDGDTLHSINPFNIREIVSPDYSYERVFFFTDRSVYRSGQLVHFKGVALSSEDGVSSSPITHRELTVRLGSPNRRSEDLMKVSTNEYGAFYGSFIAPEGITGTYRLSTSEIYRGEHSVNVEEYKRPAFFIELQSPETAFVMGDSIQLKGIAQAFAGFAVVDAEVNYRVVRTIRQPFRSGIGFFLPDRFTREVEVAFGSTRTDQNGSYSINFVAESEAVLENCRWCTYQYRIYAEVIDISGELRSTLKELGISAIPIHLDVQIPQQADKSDEIKIRVATFNSDGVAISSKLNFEFMGLQAPDTEFFDRKWDTPTRYYLSENEFMERFPHYSYDKEHLPENWAHGPALISKTIESDGQIELVLPSGLSPGTYRLFIRDGSLATDEILFEGFIDVTDFDNRIVAGRNPLEVNLDRDFYQPGDSAILLMGSRFSDLHLLTLVENHDGFPIVHWETGKPETNSASVRLVINEENLGGIYLHVFSVRKGHTFNRIRFINVPFLHKNFQIRPVDLPAVVEPGSQQKWKFQLLDHNGNPANSTILASMYDQSLDEIKPHQWSISLYHDRKLRSRISPVLHQAGNSRRGFWRGSRYQYFRIDYPDFQTRFLHIHEHMHSMQRSGESPPGSEAIMFEMDAASLPLPDTDPSIVEEQKMDAEFRLRENLNETVFFFPDIQTDKNGYFYLDFEMNEAMTNWKLLILALDPEFRHGIATFEVKTSSDLIVLPNWPRFFMQNDQILLPVRLINNTNEADGGIVTLKITDPVSRIDWTNRLTEDAQLDFTFEGGGSDVRFFKLNIPPDAPALLDFAITGFTSSASDGEKKLIQILSSNVWITESFPFFLKNGETLERMLNLKDGIEGGIRSTIFEYTAEPLFLAIQSMPVAADQNARNSLTHFRNFYHTQLAMHRIDQHPVILDYVRNWVATNMPVAELLRNEDLRDISIENTPWRNQALQQQQTINELQLLLNPNQLRQQMRSSLFELQKQQNTDGGFSWFSGGRSNFFITLQILNGFANLHKEGISHADPAIGNLIRNALNFTDEMAKDQYRRFFKDTERTISPELVSYLHMKTVLEPWNTDFDEWEALIRMAKRDWTKFGNLHQAILGITFSLLGEEELAQIIAESLIERSRYERGKGRFIPASERWEWYSNSLLIHSRFIEFLDVKGGFEEEIAEVQEYLLHHRRVNGWAQSGVSVETIGALFANREKINPATEIDLILLNGKRLPKSLDEVTPGSGYFRTDILDPTTEMELKIKHTTENISWGTIYHQYFEDIRKVQTENNDDNPISLVREWMVEELTERGPVLRRLNDGESLIVGQKLVSRMVLKLGRPMEYIQIRDLRPSALEPGNELSGYRFRDGLGYYYAPGDAYTDFYFDRIQAGTYVLEYSTHVAYAGNFPSGLIKVQSYFAPEFIVYGNSGGDLNVVLMGD